MMDSAATSNLHSDIPGGPEAPAGTTAPPGSIGGASPQSDCGAENGSSGSGETPTFTLTLRQLGELFTIVTAKSEYSDQIARKVADQLLTEARQGKLNDVRSALVHAAALALERMQSAVDDALALAKDIHAAKSATETSSIDTSKLLKRAESLLAERSAILDRIVEIWRIALLEDRAERTYRAYVQELAEKLEAKKMPMDDQSGAPDDESADDDDDNFGEDFDSPPSSDSPSIPCNLGRWEAGYCRKMVVEDCLALGVRMLKSKGLFYNTFDEGELVWTAAGASADPIRIKFRWLHQPETLPLLTLILTFDQDGIKVTTPQYITLVARQIAANGSGLAWHFECPVLRVPVRKLFLPPGEKVFASQKAHNLCYRSQLLSRKQRERAKREAAERVRQQQAQS